MSSNAAHKSQSRDSGVELRAEIDDGERVANMVHEHYDFLWRTLRRFGVPQADTDDAAQEVFMVASRRVADIELGKERAFLVGAAFRIASTRRRTRARRPEDLNESMDDRPDVVANPEVLTGQLRARAMLEEILDQMPDELRAAFVLFELEELTAPETAKLLDIPVGTVASRVRRARELFRQGAEQMRAKLAEVES